MGEVKYCYPGCNLFKCGKNATLYKSGDIWCRWTDERCTVANCNYATCIKRRLLPKGVCGETIKRKTTEKRMEEAVGPPIRLRGKALRRVGEKEIF
ncbi:MAG: hypothetical protein JSV51_04685 [Candidatus Bathyarchaeota archaeon]|nr:MAG: hypothetical protein JSV51_04685 [Candidatus Bathyarchaeota archaeon]